MDSEVSMLLDRAENELVIALALDKLSEKEDLASPLDIPRGTTFYSSVISHCYYAIFNSAKAYLVSKKVKLEKQGQHQQVYFAFRRMVKEGIIEKELLKIYEDLKVKAESLLEILNSEREKRKTFTYETVAQANKKPAEDSIKNAKEFISHIKRMIGN